MKKIIYTLLLVSGMLSVASCNDYETYADLKEKEQNAISNYISRKGIQVIDEVTFKNQGETTDTTLNQYVLDKTLGGFEMVYSKVSSSDCENKLPLSGRSNMEYYVKYNVVYCNFFSIIVYSNQNSNYLLDFRYDWSFVFKKY